MLEKKQAWKYVSGSNLVSNPNPVQDVIKSGGEWISSIDVENAAMSHPQVWRSPHPPLRCRAGLVFGLPCGFPGWLAGCLDMIPTGRPGAVCRGVSFT